MNEDSSSPPTYAVISPVRNEIENLDRLFEVLRTQTVKPSVWIIVDTGSDDGTDRLAADYAAAHDWIRAVEIDAELARGGPIVRAFNTGLSHIPAPVDVVVKLDADISFEADYFARLLDSFSADARLGIASGSCFEQRNGEWRERHVTGDHVWGACRAYRAACLEAVSPLEERMGWDGIDALKANARGWRTGILPGLAFRHHRGEGSRDGGRAAPWLARGRAAHYMGYRPSFLLARVLHHSLRDPMALMMIAGWLKPLARREPICADPVALEYLRRQQRLRVLPARAREALGARRGD